MVASMAAGLDIVWNQTKQLRLKILRLIQISGCCMSVFHRALPILPQPLQWDWSHLSHQSAVPWERGRVPSSWRLSTWTLRVNRASSSWRACSPTSPCSPNARSASSWRNPWWMTLKHHCVVPSFSFSFSQVTENRLRCIWLCYSKEPDVTVDLNSSFWRTKGTICKVTEGALNYNALSNFLFCFVF